MLVQDFAAVSGCKCGYPPVGRFAIHFRQEEPLMRGPLPQVAYKM